MSPSSEPTIKGRHRDPRQVGPAVGPAGQRLERAGDRLGVLGVGDRGPRHGRRRRPARPAAARSRRGTPRARPRAPAPRPAWRPRPPRRCRARPGCPPARARPPARGGAPPARAPRTRRATARTGGAPAAHRRDAPGDPVGEPVHRGRLDRGRGAEAGELGRHDLPIRREQGPTAPRGRRPAGRRAAARGGRLGHRATLARRRRRADADGTGPSCAGEHTRRAAPGQSAAARRAWGARPHRRGGAGRGHAGAGPRRGGPPGGGRPAPARPVRRSRPAGLGPGPGPARPRRRRPRVRGRRPRPAGRARRAADRGLDRAGPAPRRAAACAWRRPASCAPPWRGAAAAWSGPWPARRGARDRPGARPDRRRAPARAARRRARRAPARVPARTFGGFRDLVPIGQARMAEGAAVCLWALERYEDRGVLSLGTLGDDPLRVGPITPGAGAVEVWDDRGRRYEVARSTARPGPAGARPASRCPGVDPEVRALGVRLSDLPGRAPARGGARTGWAVHLRGRGPAAVRPRDGGPGVGRRPHLRRGRERRPDARVGARRRPTPRASTCGCWWSTTARPTAPPTSPRPSPREEPGSPCCAVL